MPLPVTTAWPIGPETAAWVCPESPCLPFGTRSPSGLVSGFCAAIKFTAKTKKRKTDANLIFPWGSFISVTSLLWILLRLLDQDEQKKPGLYERVSTPQRSNA